MPPELLNPARSVLANPGLRRLLAGRVISVAGSGFGPVAVAFAVLDRSAATSRDLSLVLAAQAIAQVAVVLAGGVVADRWPRRVVLIVAELIAGVGYAAFAVAHLRGDVPIGWLAAAGVVAGAGSALLLPALTRTVVEVVPRHDLQVANAVLRMGTHSASVLGLVAAGSLVAWWGPGPALLANAASFVAAAIVLAGLPRPATVAEPLESAADPRAGVLSELREGARAFVETPWLPTMVVAAGVLNAVTATTFGILGPTAAVESSGPFAWSLVLASYMLGTLLALVSSMQVRPRRPLLLCSLLTPLLALPAVALAVDAPWLIVGAAAAAAGAGFSLFSVAWESTLQRHVRSEVLGRVSSFNYLVALALKPLGLLAAGALLATYDLRTVAALLAGVALLAGLAPTLATSVRTLTDDQEAITS